MKFVTMISSGLSYVTSFTGFFSPKFMAATLGAEMFRVKISEIGLVGLIDAKGIDVAQPIWLSDVSSKTGKKCIFCVFRLFLPLRRTTSLPYRLSYINALHNNHFY